MYTKSCKLNLLSKKILDNKKIKTFNIEKMWGIGTPEDLNTFLESYKEI